MLGADPGLVQADDAGERHTDRDRHVHVGAAGLERIEGRAEERLAGESDGRHGDGRRQPVEQGARGAAHRAVMARPYGDRQQHDIGGGKACDREAAQQLARLAVLLGARRHRSPRCEAKAEGGNEARVVVRLACGAAPLERQPSRREIDAGCEDRGNARQKAFDQPDAGGAVEAVDQQVECEGAVAGIAREAGEVGFEGQRAMRTALLEAPIEGDETCRADDGMGAGTAGAAEVARRAQRIAAMQAAARCGGRRRKAGESDVAHRRNIRLVSAKCRSPASTMISRSQLPRAGRST